MDKKIKEFKITPDYFVGRAIDNEIDGDIPNALYNIKRAIDYEDNDLYLTLKLASYYEAMEMYEEANNIYLSIIASHGAIMHCFYALCDNMYYLGDEDAAGYYLRQYNNVSDTNEDREEIAALAIKHLKEKQRKEYVVVPSYVRYKSNNELRQAFLKAREGDLKGAITALDEVSVESEDGSSAYMFKLKCLFNLKRYREMQAVAEQLLSVEPTNMYAIDLMIDCSIKLKDTEKEQYYLGLLEEIKPTDRDELKELILAQTERRLFSVALENAKDYMSKWQYDMNMQTHLGALYYNTGKYQEAIKAFTVSMRVLDNFGIIAYFKSLAETAVKKKTLDAPKSPIINSNELPLRESQFRWLYIVRRIKELDMGLLPEMLWSDNKFKVALRYALGEEYELYDYENGETPLTQILQKLTQYPCEQGMKFFADELLKGYVPDSVKQLLLFHLAYTCYSDSVKFSYGRIYCEVSLDKKTLEYPVVFRDAYAHIISILGCITRKFERELKKVMTKALDNFKALNKEFRSYQALAAAIVSSMNMHVDLSDINMLCDIFSCNRDSMKRYKKELNL